VSLAAETIGDGERTVLICHGILGSRRNWRSFARGLVAALPGWRVVVVDLRGHGDSSDLGPPYTVAQCAQDLADLDLDPEVVVGHSFGGKVVLAYTALLPRALRQTWVLDAIPGPTAGDLTANEVSLVIAALKGLPTLERRTELIDILTGQGFSPTLARWMTTNLQRTPDGLTWRFDLDAIQALIADYFALDLWDVLETPTSDLEIHVVQATRSDRWTPEVLARFADLPLGSDVLLHELDAGHWVHVDAPGALIAMMAEHF
jgi:esterase